MGHFVRIELTRKVLLVKITSHYTILCVHIQLVILFSNESDVICLYKRITIVCIQLIVSKTNIFI